MQSIIASFCFWTEKASSIEKLVFIPTLFLSGLLAPVESFPNYIKSWIYFTTNINNGLLTQLLWVLFFFLIFKRLWRIGTKKFTAMGL